MLLCEVASYGKSSIPIFQVFLATIEKKIHFGRKTGHKFSSSKFLDFADFSSDPNSLSRSATGEATGI